MMIPAPGGSASQKHIDLILVDIRISSAPTNIHHFSVSHSPDALEIASALATLYINPMENGCGLITTLLTINAMQRGSAINLISRVTRVHGAVKCNTQLHRQLHYTMITEY